MKRLRRTEYVRTEHGDLVREDTVSELNRSNREGPHPQSDSTKTEFTDYRGTNGNRKQNEQEQPYIPGKERQVNTNGSAYRRTSDPGVTSYGGPRGAFDEAPQHPKDAPSK